MIADIESNKKLSLILTELFLRGRKLTFFLYHLLSLVHLFFKVPNTIRLNTTRYFIMKTLN